MAYYECSGNGSFKMDSSKDPSETKSEYLSLMNPGANSYISGSKTISYISSSNCIIICSLSQIRATVGPSLSLEINGISKTTKLNNLYIFGLSTGDIAKFNINCTGYSSGGAAAYYDGTIYMNIYT